MPLTYSSYLQLDSLLGLQRPLSDGPEHDETLFIVIHQVYELWFKQILHEVGHLQLALRRDDVPTVLFGMKRILCVMKTLVGQVDILETMTPLSFSSFRTRLETSSGFQSVQFRELEMRLGYRSAARTKAQPEGSPERARLEAILTEPSLYDDFLGLLARRGVPIPAAVLNRDVAESNPEDPDVRAALIAVYRARSDLAVVSERLVDLDEGLQEWRYRHVKMVERTIGSKQGTGGSAGSKYLRTTLNEPAFPDLWEIRAQL